MATEVERKFRLPAAPEWLSDYPSNRIAQGYLAAQQGDGIEVRVRRYGDDAWLAVKRGSGRTRGETEIVLSDWQFEELWPLTEGRRIHKVRHRVPHGELTITVDVFDGDLGELVIGEVEFDSEAASDEFDAPDWLGTEVTGDPRYLNETLAVHGAPQEDSE